MTGGNRCHLMYSNAIREFVKWVGKGSYLKSSERLILQIIISRFHWNNASPIDNFCKCFPSYETLADDAGMSRAATAEVIRKLVIKGVIFKGTSLYGGSHKSNMYVLNVNLYHAWIKSQLNMEVT